MVNEDRLEKIRSVYQAISTFKSPAGKVYKYLVWYGHFSEGGKPKNIYLGRELPERFRCLLKKREYSRDPENYYWPARGKGVERNKTQVNQANYN
jgi:hypothetical protein